MPPRAPAWRRRALSTTLCALALALAPTACGGDGHAPTGPGNSGAGGTHGSTAATLQLRLVTATLGSGERLDAAVRALDSTGVVMSSAALVWSSSAPDVAAVTESGEVTGNAPGTATIRVTSGDAGDSLAVTVVPGPTAVVLAAGDIAECPTGSATGTGADSTAGLIQSLTGTVITLGDDAYPDGSAQAYANCYDPTWGRFRDRTRPVPGNHEYLTLDARGYFGYFGAAAGDPKKGYYSYDLNGWHVVALNGEVGFGTGTAELAWLQQDLAAHPAACTLAYWHEPRFSSGSEHGNSTGPQAVWQALDAAGVELVLNGHDHDYERFAPQTPDGVRDDAHGIREFVAGTGGAHPYTLGTRRANSEVFHAGSLGALRLTLYAGGYAWEFVPTDPGGFRDSGSGSCH